MKQKANWFNKSAYNTLLDMVLQAWTTGNK